MKITIAGKEVDDFTKKKLLEDFKKYLVQPLLKSNNAKIDRIDNIYDIDSIETYNSDEEILKEYKEIYQQVLQDLEKIKLNELIKDETVSERFDFLNETEMGKLQLNQLDGQVTRKLLGDVAETQEAEVKLKMGLDDFNSYFEKLYEEPKETDTKKPNEKEKILKINEFTNFTELDKFKKLRELGFVDISISEANVANYDSYGKLNPSASEMGTPSRSLFYQNIIPIYRGKQTSPLGPNSKVDAMIYKFGIEFESKGIGKEMAEQYKKTLNAIQSINQDVGDKESFRTVYVDELYLEIERIEKKDRKKLEEFEETFDVTVNVTEDGKEVIFDKKGRPAITKPKRNIDVLSEEDRKKIKAKLSKIKTKSKKEIFKEASEQIISPILAKRLKQLKKDIDSIAKGGKKISIGDLLGLPTLNKSLETDELIDGARYSIFKTTTQKSRPPEQNNLPKSPQIKQGKISFTTEVKKFLLPLFEAKKEYIENKEMEMFGSGKQYYDKQDVAKKAYTETKEFANKHFEIYMNDLENVYDFTLIVRERTLKDGTKKYEINRIQARPRKINFKGGGRFSYGGKTVQSITRGDKIQQEQQLNTVILSIKRRFKNLKTGLE